MKTFTVEKIKNNLRRFTFVTNEQELETIAKDKFNGEVAKFKANPYIVVVEETETAFSYEENYPKPII